jgi:hypothetical protein
MVPNLITLCTEVQLKIYSFACMDDGRTGCVLSAVSKLVRDLSAEYRYQSVAVAGSVSLCAFLRELKNLPPELRRVRHLFISDYSLFQPSRASPRYRAVHPHTDNSLHELLQHVMHLSGFESLPDPENIGQIIADILEIVSKTLITLTLVSFTPYVNENTQNDISLLDHSFTSLVELTVRGPHILPISNSFAPSLQRLHLSSDALPQEFGRTAALNHPSLTHVRVSRLMNIQRHFRGILELSLAMSLRPRSPNKVDIATMPHKKPRFLLVEPGVYLSHGRGRHRGGLEKRYPQGYDGLLKAFEILKPRSRGFFLLQDHPGYGQGLERHYAREEWFSRLEGHQGCWRIVTRDGMTLEETAAY